MAVANASTPALYTIANTFFISITSFLGLCRCRDRDVGQLVERLAPSSLAALTRRRQGRLIQVDWLGADDLLLQPDGFPQGLGDVVPVERRTTVGEESRCHLEALLVDLQCAVAKCRCDRLQR